MKHGVRILQCKCEHPYQDKRYGEGMRVFNYAPAKGQKPNRYRCSICGQEREAT